MLPVTSTVASFATPQDRVSNLSVTGIWGKAILCSGGAILCIDGCSSASWLSSLDTDSIPPPPPAVTIKSVSEALPGSCCKTASDSATLEEVSPETLIQLLL